MLFFSRFCGTVLMCLTCLGVQAQSVVRHPVPDFPIAQAVEVPSDYTTVYVSGTVPEPISEDKFGTTQQQTESVLASIKKTLSTMDLGMEDVVKMQVFLVGDPAQGGQMDFAGFMKGYEVYFGTKDQPELPARSVMQVAGLVHPGWLVEIEVIAVRK